MPRGHPSEVVNYLGDAPAPVMRRNTKDKNLAETHTCAMYACKECLNALYV